MVLRFRTFMDSKTEKFFAERDRDRERKGTATSENSDTFCK